MSTMKVSDIVAKVLEEKVKSKHVFLLSGGGMMHLLNSIGSNKFFHPIATHHEQAASIAADIYSKISDTPGICFVTTGPGCSNAITGVAGAFMDSHPTIFISGQVSRANSKRNTNVRQIGIQEIDPIPLVNSITKYAVTVWEPKEIKYHLEKAIYLATTGRPGPVWIDIPLDVQGATVDLKDLKEFNPSELVETNKNNSLQEQFKTLIEKIKTAKRPLLVLGGGVHLAGLRDEVEGLVKLLNIPVQTSWNGMDLIEENHPLFFGRANLFGPRYPNFIIQNCDLLISLGARLGMQHTGYNIKAFAREAYKVMVDIDGEELNKPHLNIDLKINDDLKNIFPLFKTIKESFQPKDEWIQYCNAVKKEFPKSPSKEIVSTEKYVNPYYFTKVLSDCLPEDIVFPIGSSGMGHTIITGIFEVKKGQRVFTSKGLAAMGYGLPSTIGACFASNFKKTITLVGDGGFQLNIQELQTIVHHQLPIKIFVFNNEGYHSIKMTQKNFFNGNFVGSTKESGVSLPDLKKISDAYGISYSKILNNVDLDHSLNEFLSKDGPGICEIYIDPDKPLEPKLASFRKADGTMESNPLEDMTPNLTNEEFNKWMLIKSLRE